jgi:hypothetical protein
MRLTEIDIRQAVRSVDFTHGKALFENGFVQSCSIESEDELALTIISMVASDVDEDLRSYVQTIYLRRKFGKVKINGTCTCKSPLNCRHIVAASLYHLYNSNNTEPFQQLSEWIVGIKKNLISKQGVKKAEQEYCLTYRIFDSDTQEKEGDLRIYKSKILKNGEVTGGLVCSTHNVLYGNGYSDHGTLKTAIWWIGRN